MSVLQQKHSNQDITGGPVGDVEYLEERRAHHDEEEEAEHDGAHLGLFFLLR